MKRLFRLNLIVILLLSCISIINAQTQIGSALEHIPADYENDLWLNTHFREMNMGSTYQIVARRVPEIVENAVSSNVTLPTFHYTVVSGNSVSVNKEGLVSANSLGTSIIEVKYDAITVNNNEYGAVSPVNITYVAIDVMDPSSNQDVTLSTSIKNSHYDTHYFFGSGIDYIFSVNASGADKLTVKCNGIDADNSGETYTVRLQNRANIIEIIAFKGETPAKKLYYVIDGRKVEISVKNATDATRLVPIVGDKVQVSFKGITIPVYKLATIYNPQSSPWGDPAKVVYQNQQLGSVATNVNLTQYDLANNNTIEFTATTAGEYTFTGGKITESWWGSKLGTELDMEGPGTPNLNATTESGEFSQLPAFRVYVSDSELASNAISLDLSKASTPSEFAYNEKNIWTETYTENSYPYIKSQIFSFSHLPSNNSWGGITWDGFTVSKSTDNSTNHTDFPARQWGNMAQGGISGEGTPYLLGFYSNFLEQSSEKKSNEILFENGEKNYIPQGVFVNNTTYASKSIEDGFFVARKFTKDDTFVLTAHAIDKDKKATGKSATYYLADYRAEKPQDRILNHRWEWFDLSSLGDCAGIYFTMNSTDSGEYGMNTASYFAMDKIIAVPSISTSVDHSFAKKELHILPNPATNYITASTSGQLEIYNLNGMKIYENSAYKAGEQINVSNLSAGLYFVKVAGQTMKLLKQ